MLLFSRGWCHFTVTNASVLAWERAGCASRIPCVSTQAETGHELHQCGVWTHPWSSYLLIWVCIWGRYDWFFLDYKAGSRTWNRHLVWIWIFYKEIIWSYHLRIFFAEQLDLGAFSPTYVPSPHSLSVLAFIPIPLPSWKQHFVKLELGISQSSYRSILNFKYLSLLLDCSLPWNRIHVWLVFLQWLLHNPAFWGLIRLKGRFLSKSFGLGSQCLSFWGFAGDRAQWTSLQWRSKPPLRGLQECGWCPAIFLEGHQQHWAENHGWWEWKEIGEG